MNNDKYVIANSYKEEDYVILNTTTLKLEAVKKDKVLELLKEDRIINAMMDYEEALYCGVISYYDCLLRRAIDGEIYVLAAVIGEEGVYEHIIAVEYDEHNYKNIPITERNVCMINTEELSAYNKMTLAVLRDNDNLIYNKFRIKADKKTEWVANRNTVASLTGGVAIGYCGITNTIHLIDIGEDIEGKRDIWIETPPWEVNIGASDDVGFWTLNSDKCSINIRVNKEGGVNKICRDAFRNVRVDCGFLKDIKKVEKGAFTGCKLDNLIVNDSSKFMHGSFSTCEIENLVLESETDEALFNSSTIENLIVDKRLEKSYKKTLAGAFYREENVKWK